VPFINAEDIAAAAFAAFPVDQPPNRIFCSPGPSDELRRSRGAIGRAAGRTIRHCRVGPKELASRHQARGLPVTEAQVLAAMDVAIAGGAEERTTDALQALIGPIPRVR